MIGISRAGDNALCKDVRSTRSSDQSGGRVPCARALLRRPMSMTVKVLCTAIVLSSWWSPLLAQERRDEFEALASLRSVWEMPLDVPAVVAFQPDGEKAILVDSECATAVDRRLGKVLRRLPHDLPEFSVFVCTGSEFSAETGNMFAPHRLHLGKLSAMRRLTMLKARDPTYSSNGQLFACVDEEGGQVFGTQTGQWGNPKFRFEMKESLDLEFFDDDRRLVAVSRTGEFLTINVSDGQTIASGQLANWPRAHVVGNGAGRFQRLAIVPSAKRLLFADGDIIRAYDISNGGALPPLQNGLHPHYLVTGSQTSIVLVRVGASQESRKSEDGKIRVVLVDAVTGRCVGRLPEFDEVNSLALSPSGDCVLGVTGAVDKKRRKTWTARAWALR